MDYIIPPINLKGKFKLKEPVTGLINENVIYTVTNIRSISTLLDDNIDVLTLVYLDRGLTHNDYVNDLEHKVPIVTLVSEGGTTIDIPSRFISNVPQITGKEFVNRAVIINLGYLPNDLNLDFLKVELKDLVDSLLGVDSTSSIEDISGTLLMDLSKYEAFEATRLSKISNNVTCRSLLRKAEESLRVYKLKVKALVKKIDKITSQ